MRLIKVKLSLFILLCCSSLFAYANNDYKCFVSLANQQSKIVLVKLKQNEKAEQAKAQLLNFGIFAEDGKTQLAVKSVHECVPYAVSFTNPQAQTLEENTVF